jgi:hypothetical protein
MQMTAVWTACGASGCAWTDGSRTHLDEGEICIYESEPAVAHRNEPDQTYSAGQPIHLSVTLGCLSACIRDEAASCDVTRAGQTLVVHSVHSYEPPPADEGCIALCNALSAVCASEPLEAGTYRIVHGSQTYSLAIPSSAERACR